MKDLSVSYFKAKLAACLREVQQGETLVITEHSRPIAEVTSFGSGSDLMVPAAVPFTLVGTRPSAPFPGLWKSLLDSERGEQ